MFSFDRTYEELKHSIPEMTDQFPFFGFDRTYEELKLDAAVDHDLIASRQVLIVPMRNWNP